MRVTVIVGARQVGKTTVAQQIAAEHTDSTYVTLDEEVSRRAALDDPAGFVARLKPLSVIDEVQRAPDLMLAIKLHVDRAQQPGHFLLTGSANLPTTGTIPDALPGRAGYVSLFPFSQAEMGGVRPRVIEKLFDGEMPEAPRQLAGVEPYLERIVAGGYPEAHVLTPEARDRFFDGYTRTILSRDVEDVARVERRDALTRVLRLVAARSTGPLNVTAIARETGVDDKTGRRYFGVLENLFLVSRLPAWSRNIVKRQVKMPKAVISDTGLLSHLLNADHRYLADPVNGRLLGMFFETFAINEFIRLCSVERSPISLFHYRDRDNREVDLLLERNDGSLVGVEFKASATVRPSDFRHLDFLSNKTKGQMRSAVIVYAGESSVQFSPGRYAVPLAALWA